jgi:hypothetical protein
MSFDGKVALVTGRHKGLGGRLRGSSYPREPLCS